jgi:DNA polymerase/3'-5' exonuclease PolX
MLTYPEAKELADSLVAALSPHCARIEVAGSLRRRKPVVKDIEIVAITKSEERTKPGLLFEEPAATDVLFADWAEQGAVYQHPYGAPAKVQWIKPGTKNDDPLEPWKVEPFGSYWRGLLWLEQQYEQEEVDWSLPERLLPPRVKLDLFLTTPDKWGVIFLLRTGSKDFNTALIAHLNTSTLMRIRDGRIMDRGQALDTPEEKDIFEAAGLEWVEPEDRKDAGSIRRRPKTVGGS